MVVRGEVRSIIEVPGARENLEVVGINRTIINFAILRRPPVPFGK
jgi:hypothetical protein